MKEKCEERRENSNSIKCGRMIVDICKEEGGVMAGDSRATSGKLRGHRAVEEVCAADAFSGVGISGAAGPAMDMVRLFHLPHEHYETQPWPGQHRPQPPFPREGAIPVS